MLYTAHMNAQGVTPPNLPIPSSEDKPPGTDKPQGADPGALGAKDNKREIPPVIPQASPARGELGEVPVAGPQSPPPSKDKEIINKPPGGGLDAPDPFMAGSGANQNKETKPLVDSSRSGGVKKTGDIPPATNAGSISAPSIGVSLGAGGKPLPDTDISGATPIPPTAFREPELPRRGRRKIAVIMGGIVILLLLMAIGFVAARFVLSNFGQSNNSNEEAETDDNIQVEQTDIDTQEENLLVPVESVGTDNTKVEEEPSETPQETTVSENDSSDLDQDGLTADEEKFYGTDPNKADTDEDGYNDGDEVRSGYDPLGPGKLDSDNDGFPDPDEREFGTDPFNPDTDGDGYSDGDEIQNGYNPLIPSPGDKL